MTKKLFLNLTVGLLLSASPLVALNDKEIDDLQDSVRQTTRQVEDHMRAHPGMRRVVLFGPSQNGKTTLAHYIIGEDAQGQIPLVVKGACMGNKFLIPERALPRAAIAQDPGVNSATVVPTPFTFQHAAHPWCLFDCPGLGDNRGIPQEILNTHAINKLFADPALPQSRILLVLKASSLANCVTSGLGKLLHDIVGTFPGGATVHQATSLVVTETEPGATITGVQEHLQNLAAQMHGLNDDARGLLHFLATNGQCLALMPKPVESVGQPYSKAHRDAIMGAIKAATFTSIAAPPLHFANIVVHDVRDTATRINKEIYDFLSGTATTIMAQTCVSRIKGNLERLDQKEDQLRTLFSEWKTSIENLNGLEGEDARKAFKRMLKILGVDVNSFKVRTRRLDFLRETVAQADVSYDTPRWYAALRGMLNRLNVLQHIGTQDLHDTQDYLPDRAYLDGQSRNQNQKIIDFLRKDTAEVIEKACNTTIDGNTGSGAKHAVELRQTFQRQQASLEALAQPLGGTTAQERASKFPETLKTTFGQGVEDFKKRLSKIAFLHTLTPNAAYELGRWSQALDLTIRKLAFLGEMKQGYVPEESTVYRVSGALVDDYDVREALKGKTPTRVDIFVWNTFWMREDLKPETSVALLAPRFLVSAPGNQVVTLNLRGQAGEAYTTCAAAGTDDSSGTGKDGQSGKPGKNGYALFFKTSEIPEASRLALTTQGGKGGRGQDGGRGGRGGKGNDEVHHGALTDSLVHAEDGIHELAGYRGERARRIARITAWGDGQWIYSLQFAVRTGGDGIQEFARQGICQGTPQTLHLNPDEKIVRVCGARSVDDGRIPTGGLQYIYFETNTDRRLEFGVHQDPNFHLSADNTQLEEAVQFRLWSSAPPVAPNPALLHNPVVLYNPVLHNALLVAHGPADVLGGCDPIFGNVTVVQERRDGQRGGQGGRAGRGGAGGLGGMLEAHVPAGITFHARNHDNGGEGDPGNPGNGGEGGINGVFHQEQAATRGRSGQNGDPGPASDPQATREAPPAQVSFAYASVLETYRRQYDQMRPTHLYRLIKGFPQL